ncbi:hypothetical protein X741_29405 [Mesorhizobium sp. LNHC229A00]|nr:hypothetical protein X741_29405 [Mesorhizobium sp. LNHC229A00]
MLLAVPGVDARQVNMLPTQRRDMLQQRIWDVPSRSFELCDRAVEINSVPVDDRADDKIEARCAECLTFERPVAEFATPMKEDGAFEFVRCFALVEAGLAAPAQCQSSSTIRS